MVLFKTEDLSFTYPKCKLKALDCVSLSINKGEFILLMGRTGSGKSTLLRMLKKELSPVGSVEGQITVSSKQTGFVIQNTDVSFVAENVRGELAFALENMKLKNDEIAVRIGETASFFNLSDMLDKKISSLSGGERAVVAIASAMICDADALILDEPLAQLDPKSTAQLISLLKRVNEELGVTVIMSSHTADGIIDFCDRLIIIEEGKIASDGSPQNLKNSEEALDYFPIYTSLFDERPLTVKEAIPLAHSLNEKNFVNCDKTQTVAELKNITFAYGKNERDILSSLTFKAYKGAVHSIIGANGSGKTTLLKVLAGIKKAYSGKVKVNGKIAYMPQNPRYLFTKDTVLEEIDEQTAKVFGLSDYLFHHPYDLSGGQMQKLALAILSKQDFDIMLLDEPSKALDSFSKKNLKVYIKDLAKQGKTVIIVSHDLDFVGDVSDYVSFLSDGIITITGDRRQVLSSLNFYTTQIRRITKAHLKSAVSTEDLI
ncbi:MAG: ATP-binding cassette domain-containing protein [Eubacterium sp.]|nr:ATP-binding cassette domain-containing protein [Eubacterium sp.]